MKIFVSYSRDSETIARSVVADLESLGHEVWFDRELSGGQAWWDQILGAIRDCALMVFLMHPKSLASVACARERSYAMALGKPILPLQVADGISINLLPPELAQLQIVAYRSGEKAEVLALARAVAKAPSAPPLPDPLPPPPEVPASYLGAMAMRIDGTQPLDYQAQSAILIDLRQALREPDSRVDADILLSRLRKRRDLFAAIAEEIDALRDRTQAPVARRGEPERPAAPSPIAAPPPIASTPPSPAPPSGDRPQPAAAPMQGPRGAHPAWWSTGAGAVLGAVSVVVYTADRPFDSALWIVVAACAASGLLSGLLAGRRAGSWWLAVGGACAGFAGWAVFFSMSRFTSDWHLAALAFGAAPGAALGAALGWFRQRQQT